MSAPAAPSCRGAEDSPQPGELAVARVGSGPGRHAPVSDFALTDGGADAASCPRKQTHAHTEKEQHR